MPLKKVEWGDIPNIECVTERDLFGTWIECNICDVKIRVRSQFCFTEWNTHCSGVKHSKVANSKAFQDVPKIDTFFKKRSVSEKHSTGDTLIHKNDYDTKRKKNEFLPRIFLWEKYRFVTSV